VFQRDPVVAFQVEGLGDIALGRLVRIVPDEGDDVVAGRQMRGALFG
jgi:hypothetical protein